MSTLALEPGVVIDRYEIESTLGQGGMAVVYRVRHRTLGSWHALKILTVHGAAVRDRLIREGRVQASLVDPNIVAVTDVIDVNGSPGLIMQFVDGPNLEKWLAENRPNLEEAERLFEGILSALEHAHSKGVVHRDLKPANVLLAQSGGRLTPRVADFGLAKALHEEGATGATRAGALMGTPSYMPPEQIRDASTTDHRGDIFALGCILYELVIGRVAFQGEHYLDVFNDIRAGHYPRPASVKPDLPARVDMAIRGALITDRERRIPDCATLRSVLLGKRKWDVGDEGTSTVSLTIGPSDGNSQTIGPISFFDERDTSDSVPLPTPAPPVRLEPAPPAPSTSPAAPTASRPSAPAVPPAPIAQPTLAPASRPAWQLAVGGFAVLAVAVVVARLAFPGAAAPPGAPAALSSADVAVTPPAQPEVGPAVPPAAKDGPSGLAVAVAGAPGPGGDGTPAAEPGSLAGGAVTAETAQRAAEKAAAAKAAGRAATDKAATDKAAADKAAAKPPDARFTYTGAEDVRLVGSAGSFRTGPVPAGDYTIKATFAGVTNSAGSISLAAGQSVALRCDADFATCEK